MQLPARLGKYELVEFLGGGMSHVYRARDTLIGRTVAVKILTPEGCADPEVKERFLQEARMAGNICHENVISIYDFGESDGQLFLVMEFLQGEDLRGIIRGGRVAGVTEKLQIALQVSKALEYIHEQKIVHRDIKPDNIYVNSKGVVKLIDFGIAKVEGLSRTRAGFVLGTPYYMAPEQVRGEAVTGQVDVYAFGILLFELMTGVKPFKAETVERIFQCILNEPMDLSAVQVATIPPGVSDLIMRCVAKNPAERPNDFAEVRATLERILAPPVTATMQAPPPPVAAPVVPVEVSQRSKWMLPAALAVVALLIAVGGFLVWNSRAKPAAETLAKTIETPTGQMILIPAGEFLSGPDKKPRHLRNYYIDRTEVTNAAYEKYSQGRSRPLPEGFPKDRPGDPVTNVTIDEARDFARWAGKRLPGLLEWEKAARGTDGRQYPWGDAADASAANVSDGKLWPADRFAKDVSPWGVVNMGGNASEFVDFLRVPGAQALRHFARLMTPPPTRDEAWFTYRGGSYSGGLQSALTYEWGAVPARFRGAGIGFRCVQSIVDAQ